MIQQELIIEKPAIAALGGEAIGDKNLLFRV